LLSGFGHFLRSGPGGRETGNALERLEQGAPGRVWTVLPYGGVPQRQDDFERRFITPLPSVAIQPLTGELGDLPANRFLARPLIPSPGLALRDLADALISFGPCTTALRKALTRTLPRPRLPPRARPPQPHPVRPAVRHAGPAVPERALLPGIGVTGCADEPHIVGAGSRDRPPARQPGRVVRRDRPQTRAAARPHMSDKPPTHPLRYSGPTTEGAPMPSPRTPRDLDPDNGSGAQPQHDQAPAEPARANP
jgi:hypothetical protein